MLSVSGRRGFRRLCSWNMFQIYNVFVQKKVIYLRKCCISFMIGNFVCFETSFYTSFVCFWRYSPQWARASSFTRVLDNTQRHATFGRTPLDEWWARRRDLYLATHNPHKKTNIYALVGFQPKTSAGERPQTYTLDRAATGTGLLFIYRAQNTLE
jgi:hypothetical protein